ncbi:hypothetical protein BDQ17DRAFT_1547068 [Cyathus striatus]|nr:hypothetical protein BDQ17DRAFT_1547068 [Cyathus striatus]
MDFKTQLGKAVDLAFLHQQPEEEYTRNRNSMTRISSLPPEILLEIFYVCMSWNSGESRELAWRNVCRTWWNLARNCPRLWQCIDLCDIHLAREFIVHSKATPVSIVSSSPSNIHSFNLKINSNFLTTIDVILFPDDMQELFTVVGKHFKLPSIQRISVEGVSLAWDQCKNLTLLSLCGLEWEFSPGISQLYDVLRQSPNLEQLRLVDIHPIRDESITDIGDVESLLNLRDVVISAQSIVMAAIMSCIRFNSETNIQLKVLSPVAPTDIFPLGLQYPIDGSPHISCLHFETQELSLRLFTSSSDSPKTIILSLSSPLWVVGVAMQNIHELIDIGQIETLEFSSEVLADIPHSLLKEFLFHMKELAVLRVARNDLQALLQVLSITGGSSTPGQIACPQLRILSFTSHDDSQWVDFETKWMDRILFCLTQRKKHGSTLQLLEFGSVIQAQKKTIEQLSGVVANVNF